MGINTLDIAEDFFSSFQTTSAKLSILLGMDSFCYSICDYQQRLSFVRRIQGLRLASEHTAFQQLEADNPYLFFPFRSVSIAVATSMTTLVPDRLFVENEASTYLKYGNEHASSVVVHTDFLSNEHIRLVYGVPENVDSWLKQRFPNVEIYHLQGLLIQVFQRTLAMPGKVLVGHIWEEGLLVFLFDEGKLVFQNRFDCQTSKDFLYFLLLACDQLALSAASMNLHLSGAITRESEIFQLLYKYFLQITFVDVSDSLEKGQQAQQYPTHFFNDLAVVCQ